MIPQKWFLSVGFLAFIAPTFLLGDIPQSSSSTIAPVQIQKGTAKPTPSVPSQGTYSPTQLKKPVLPLMTKPFGMPGVIGYQNNKWEGTDYLGYLSSNISINVEILKGDNAPVVPDPQTLEGIISGLFTKNSITPHSEATEGPLLPFLHVLLIIYPVDKDHYAIFGAGRLFEQIQVMRKNFSPAGYWQGITWENQDVALATGEQLDAQIKSMVEKLSTAFIDRYRLYNPQNPEQPEFPK